MTSPTPRQALFGTPPSENYEPRKIDLQTVLEQIEILAIGPVKEFHSTLSELTDALGSAAVGDIHIVLATEPDGGVYKRGASSWTKKGPLPVVLTETVSSQQAANSAAAALSSANAAATSADNAADDADDAFGFAQSASNSADQAETLALAAGAPIYPTIAAGLAAVADGAVFLVPEGLALTIYRRVVASAVRLGAISAATHSVPQAFGAVGDGTANDTAAMAAWMEHLRTTGAPGFLPPGRYLTDALSAQDGTLGLSIAGAGAGRSIIRLRGGGSNCLSIANTPRVHLNDFSIENGDNGGSGVAGNTIALSVRNCPHSRLVSVEAGDSASAAILVWSGDPTILVDDVIIDRCRARDTRGAGIIMQEVQNSKILGSVAKNYITWGIQTKAPVRNVIMSDLTAENGWTGFGAGSTAPAEYFSEGVVATNLTALNTRSGAVFGKSKNGIVSNLYADVSEDQSGLTDFSGTTWIGGGHGLRIENSSDMIADNISAKGVISGQILVRFDGVTTDCYATAGRMISPKSGARVAAFGTSTDRNTVIALDYPPSPASSTPFQNNGGPSNKYYQTKDERDPDRYFFGRDLFGWNTSINSKLQYVFGFDEASTAWLSILNKQPGVKAGIVFGDAINTVRAKIEYTDSTGMFGWVIGEEDVLRLSNIMLHPAPDLEGTLNLGSSGARWGNVWSKTGFFVVGDGWTTASRITAPIEGQIRFGVSNTEVIRVVINAMQPHLDNTVSLGVAGNRWTQVFAATGAISTSDGREKEQVEAVPDAILDAWATVEYRRFRFVDAVASKGNGARWHVGLVAQAVRDAFVAAGLDAFEMGILCHDTWTDEETGEARDRFGLRYEEALALEAALMRRTTERLEARLAALEAA